ncbi:MAG: T9SS C-terminal target domain-containing protein, partial [Bacteroidetes bacterium]
ACHTGQYVHADSLPVFYAKIMSVLPDGLGPYLSKRIIIGNENQLSLYDISYPSGWCDSVLITHRANLSSDSVLHASVHYNKNVIIKNSVSSDNFIVYDSLLSTVLYSDNLGMKPVLADYHWAFAVLGIDSSGAYRFKLIERNNYTTLADTVFGSFLSNPTSIKKVGLGCVIIDQPGDSIARLVQYSSQGGVLQDVIIYPQSDLNVHAFYLDNEVHFQPRVDTTSSMLDRQVMVYNYSNGTYRGPFNVNSRFQLMQSPHKDDHPHIVTQKDSTDGSIYFLYSSYNWFLQDSGFTAPGTVFYKSDFRCPVKVNEYDDSRIEWKVFPNPSRDHLNFTVNGLICGREYKFDVVNSQGKVVLEKMVQAKTVHELFLENLKPGIYFLRVHTLNGPVIQKFVKE